MARAIPKHTYMQNCTEDTKPGSQLKDMLCSESAQRINTNIHPHAIILTPWCKVVFDSPSFAEQEKD